VEAGKKSKFLDEAINDDQQVELFSHVDCKQLLNLANDDIL
jgi:hypothetical protein